MDLLTPEIEEEELELETEPEICTEAFTPLTEKEMVEVLEKNRKPMIGHAMWVLKLSEMDAEDLYSETTIKALRFRERFNSGLGSITTWLYHIMANHNIDNYRRTRDRFNNSFLPYEFQGGKDNDIMVNDGMVEAEDLGEKQVSEIILNAIMLLPEKFARVLMGKINGLKYEEMSDEFKMPVGTVKNIANKARTMLAQSLVKNHVLSPDDFGKMRYMLDSPGYAASSKAHATAVARMVISKESEPYKISKRKRNKK